MNKIFIGFTAFFLYAAGSAWSADTSLISHQMTVQDQKIIDVLKNMSGENAEEIIRLYETGKGWGDVAENLGLEMEDVLREVGRIDGMCEKDIK